MAEQTGGFNSVAEASIAANESYQKPAVSPTRSCVDAVVKFVQKRYFYLHVGYFLLASLLGGLLLFFSEMNNTKVSFMDALFMSVSCISLTGLVTVEMSKLTAFSQFLCIVWIYVGGLTFTTLPLLLTRVYRAFQKLVAEKQAAKAAANNTSTSSTPQAASSSPAATTVTEVENSTRQDSPALMNVFHSKFWKKNIKEIQEADFDLDFYGDEEAVTSPVDDTTTRLRIRLPTPGEIEFWAHIHILILSTLLVHGIMLLFFMVIGLRLKYGYTAQQLEHRDPWFSSLFFTVAGFNNAGVGPFTDSAYRFVVDVPINLSLMLLCLFGNTLYPFLLRSLVIVAYRLSSMRHKVIFKYILVNHHHLTLFIYPSVQTRVYVLITILLQLGSTLGHVVFDLMNESLERYSLFDKIMIFAFHGIAARASGFATVDISNFSVATLGIYLVMMRTKPQMCCSLDEQAYQIVEVQRNLRTTNPKKLNDIDQIVHEELPNRNPKAKKQKIFQEEEDTVLTLADLKEIEKKREEEEQLKKRRFSNSALQGVAKLVQAGEGILETNFREKIAATIMAFGRSIYHHSHNLLLKNNVWIVIIIFLIVALNLGPLKDDPVSYSIFKIIFEVISAFGCCGFSLGFPGSMLSFSAFLGVPGKLLICLTMLLGRHRGLLDSVYDQQFICLTAEQVHKLMHERYLKAQLKKESRREKEVIIVSRSSGDGTPNAEQQ